MEGGGGEGVTVDATLRCKMASLPLRTGLHSLKHLHHCLRLTFLSGLCKSESLYTQLRDERERRAYLCLLLSVPGVVLTVTADLTADLSTPSISSSSCTSTTDQSTHSTLVGVAPWLLTSRGAGPTGVTVLVRWNCGGVLEWVWLGRPSANNNINKTTSCIAWIESTHNSYCDINTTTHS